MTPLPSGASDDPTRTSLPLSVPVDATGEPLPARIGDYAIRAELGRGGMGVVYLATDPRLQRDVALKLLPAGLAADAITRDGFLAEARALAAVHDPYIATIFSLEEADGRQFLTMEYLTGQTLRQRLRGGAMPINTALRVMRQVARALETAHAKGVIHRDLKPSNVMLDDADTVKVLDFGIAVRIAPEAREAQLLSATRFAGTPGYMSPEQLRGEILDGRADVWALGCVLFECVTGRHMVEADSASARAVATMTFEPLTALATLPQQLPVPVATFITRCVAPDITDRFATMREARAALEQLVADRAVPHTITERTAAVRAAAAPRGNLPNRRTRFIGREAERAATAQLFTAHRLVTVTGAGGCGKSRLALEVAWELGADAADGVWLTELAPLTDPARVAETVLAACGVTQEAGASPLAALTHLLREKDALLVLDNCEHLLDACAALVADVLTACPRVRVLATSRELLRVEGEAVFPLAPLAVPRGGAEAAESEAVQLFVDRARAVHDGFVLTPANRDAVADICRHLDGIPLALELAAARVKTLPVDKIRDLLADRFRLLTRGIRTAAPHQATLRALIDWSYDRLDAPEQTMLRRLAVFRGVWTLDGVEAVAAGGDIDAWDALDLFTRLVEKSLVACDLRSGDTARYSLLETVREYAGEKLREHPDDEALTLARHRAHILALAAEGCAALRSADLERWMPRLADAEYDVRAVAARIAADPDGGHDALSLLANYGVYWMKAGRFLAGKDAMRDVLARPDLDRTGLSYAHALLTAGNFCYRTGELDDARRYYDGARAIFAERGSAEQLGMALMNLGNIGLSTGLYDEAEPFYEQAKTCFRESGSTYFLAGCYSNLSGIAVNRGQYDRVVENATQSIALYDSLGIREAQVLPLFGLGHAYYMRGNWAKAIPYYERALRVARDARNEWHIAGAAMNMAMAHISAGARDVAAVYLRDALTSLQEVADPLLAIDCIEGVATWLLPDDARAAAFLFGAAAATREAYHSPPSEYIAGTLREAEAQLLAAIGRDAIEAARAEGAAAGWEAAVTTSFARLSAALQG